MRPIVVITDPGVARPILESLALPSRAPPFAPVSVRGDCEPALTEADGDPDFELDQSAYEGANPDDAF